MGIPIVTVETVEENDYITTNIFSLRFLRLLGIPQRKRTVTGRFLENLRMSAEGASGVQKNEDLVLYQYDLIVTCHSFAAVYQYT